MIRVGIVGGTGYTGVELLRLLLPHPEVADYYTARATQNQRWLAGMNKVQQMLDFRAGWHFGANPFDGVFEVHFAAK